MSTVVVITDSLLPSNEKKGTLYFVLLMMADKRWPEREGSIKKRRVRVKIQIPDLSVLCCCAEGICAAEVEALQLCLRPVHLVPLLSEEIGPLFFTGWRTIARTDQREAFPWYCLTLVRNSLLANGISSL